jgi:hypothetical protein
LRDTAALWMGTEFGENRGWRWGGRELERAHFCETVKRVERNQAKRQKIENPTRRKTGNSGQMHADGVPRMFTWQREQDDGCAEPRMAFCAPGIRCCLSPLLPPFPRSFLTSHTAGKNSRKPRPPFFLGSKRDVRDGFAHRDSRSSRSPHPPISSLDFPWAWWFFLQRFLRRLDFLSLDGPALKSCGNLCDSAVETLRGGAINEGTRVRGMPQAEKSSPERLLELSKRLSKVADDFHGLRFDAYGPKTFPLSE